MTNTRGKTKVKVDLDRLKNALDEKHWSIYKLCSRSETSTRTIYRVFKEGEATENTIMRIAMALRRNPKYLTGESKAKNLPSGAFAKYSGYIDDDGHRIEGSHWLYTDIEEHDYPGYFGVEEWMLEDILMKHFSSSMPWISKLNDIQKFELTQRCLDTINEFCADYCARFPETINKNAGPR